MPVFALKDNSCYGKKELNKAKTPLKVIVFMSYRAFVLIVLFSTPLVAVPVAVVQSVAACNVAKTSEPVCMSNEVNFDELEDIALECNAFEKAEFSKPSRILILLRIVGMPLFNAYLKMTDGMAKFSAWFNSIFKKNARHETRQ